MAQPWLQVEKGTILVLVSREMKRSLHSLTSIMRTNVDGMKEEFG